ncbi:MAG: PqqD family protein [Acidobacteria bacterium]|nr:PqqD family protein [Acidobacteriota bacterium]
MRDDSLRFSIGEEVTGKVIDGEGVIIDLATGIYYSLNSVGSRFWELLEAGLPLGRMAETVAGELDVPEETVRRDLEDLIDTMENAGLIEAANTGEPGTVPAPSTPLSGYDPPKLTAYHDMADLLALDPPIPGLMPDAWKPGSTDKPK